MGCSSSQAEVLVRTSIKMLLCPYCKTSIPFITLQLEREKYNLITKCTCSPQENLISLKEFIHHIKMPYLMNSKCLKHDLPGEKYCLNTSSWLCKECLRTKANPQRLDLIENKIFVICQKHSKPFACYCEDCKLNLCSYCKHDHKDHRMLQLMEIDETIIDKTYNLLDALLRRNRQIQDSIIAEIEQSIQKTPKKEDELMKLKLDLLASWKANQTVNDLLREFYKCFYITAGAVKKYPCYQILMLFTTIEINDMDVDLNFETLKERAFAWKNYLDFNWIIIQKDKDKMLKFEFSEKKEEEVQAQVKKANNPKRNKFECIGTLAEHTFPVRCLVKLDEERMASGSDDKTIKIWNTVTMTCEKTLVGHVNSVWCLLLLNDGTLVSGSFDKSIKFWTTDTCVCKATVTGHSYSVRCLVQLKERTLASGSVDKTIKLWSLITLTCKYTFTGHTSFVWSLTLINDDILASGSEDTTIKLWDTTSLNYKETLKGHTFAVKVLILFNNLTLISGSVDASIKLWNLSKLECIATLEGHELSVECLIKINDKTLISGSDDKTIRVWHINSYKCACSLTGHLSYIWCLLKLNRNQFASGSWDNSIKLWFIPDNI